MDTSVSRKVAQIEKEFGGKLFERHPKGLILTSLGQKAFKKTEPIINGLDSFKKEITQEEGAHRQRFVISTSHAIATFWLSNIINEFLRVFIYR